MTTTALPRRASPKQEKPFVDAPKSEEAHSPQPPYSPGHSINSFKRSGDSTHRKLKPRHIQLIGIGGTIGTALFVQIGQGLINGGPASLFAAFTIWSVNWHNIGLCLCPLPRFSYSSFTPPASRCSTTDPKVCFTNKKIS